MDDGRERVEGESGGLGGFVEAREGGGDGRGLRGGGQTDGRRQG